MYEYAQGSDPILRTVSHVGLRILSSPKVRSGNVSYGSLY
jgi:hypothetical protein